MEVLPVKISRSFLFIDLHIACVSSSPDAPTIPPIATKSKSFIARPAIAPATPDKLFSSEMVIGISAPPTLILKITPKARDDKSITAMSVPISQPVFVITPVAPSMVASKLAKSDMIRLPIVRDM